MTNPSMRPMPSLVCSLCTAETHQAYDLPREHWCKAALRRYLLVHGLDGIGLRQLITAALDDDLFTQFLPQFLQALAVFADKRCCC